MQLAQQRDALRRQKFHFRKSLSTRKICMRDFICFMQISLEKTPDTFRSASVQTDTSTKDDCEHRPMTINEIINGSVDIFFYTKRSFLTDSKFQSEFVGLLNIVQDYLTNIEVDADTRCTINQYLSLISKRAAGMRQTKLYKTTGINIEFFLGSLLTNAAWMRLFVANHPSYKQDSVVTDEIAYDLLWKMKRFANNEEHCPEVLPATLSKTNVDVSAAVKLDDNEVEVKRSLMQQSQQR